MKKALVAALVVLLGVIGWFYFQPTNPPTIVPVQKVQEQFYITGKVDILPSDIQPGESYGHIIVRKCPQYANKHPYDGAWWKTVREAQDQHGFLRADLDKKITIYLYE